MKVKELINVLGEFNPDADICINDGDEINVSYIFYVTGKGRFDKKTTKQVFIEPDVDDEDLI